MRRAWARLAVALGAGLASLLALSGCQASLINWANHTYTMTGMCLSYQTVTLHNGRAIGRYGFEVRLAKVYYGDLNHDGQQDAAVLLTCDAFNQGGNAFADEIQIFTTNGKLISRLIQPDRYGSGNPWGSQFNTRSLGIRSNVLFTGAFGFLSNDNHCCASRYDVYRWDWNGHGFTPVDVKSSVT